MSVKFSNNAQTTLAANINTGATSFTVVSTTNFPTLGGSDWTYISLSDEVVKVTDITGTTFTCEATTAAHTSGERVELRMTAQLLNDFLEDTEGLPLTGGTLTGDLTAPNFIGNLDGAVASGVKNGGTTTLLKGTPVYQTSTAGNNAVVEAADASNAATMPAIGVLDQDLTAGQEVDIDGLIHLGFIKGVDTSSFSEGDTIYVASGGGYTNVAPTGEGNLIQNLGKVIKVHASNGSGIVMGAGRSNATPNLNDGNVFIGNASNQSEARALQIADTTNLQTTLDGKEDAGTGVAMSIALG